MQANRLSSMSLQGKFKCAYVSLIRKTRKEMPAWNSDKKIATEKTTNVLVFLDIRYACAGNLLFCDGLPNSFTMRRGILENYMKYVSSQSNFQSDRIYYLFS